VSLSRPRLYLIDGFSNIFRAFYAIRGGLSTSKGEPTNAVFGFVTMLRKLLREDKPELLGVALDVGEKTFRSERFGDYKATRAPMPPDLPAQIERVREVLAAYRIPILEAAKFEADDVLGTLAKQASEAGYDVVLVSADKDLMQLVGPGVFVYHTGREKLYDARAVEEDFGVPPARVPDVLALMGDTVDNVPGVPGIGEKGARQLIREHGSLEALLERTGELSRKAYREGLTAHRDDALLSKELVTIRCDLPIALDTQSLRLEPPDEPALRRLFTELEFFSLADELTAAARQTPKAPLAEAREALSADQWRAAVAGLGAAPALAVIGGDGAPLGLAAATGDGVVFADFRRPGLGDAARRSLTEWLNEPEREIVGHDLKEVLRLARCEPPACARLFDLMLASYVLRPALRGHGLDEMALERLDRQAISAREAGWDKGEVPPPGDARLLAYAAERAALVAALAPALRRELDEPASRDLARVYWEIEAPLVPVLVAMEEAGVLVDREFLARMSGEMAGELASLEREIHELAGEPFNINSPQQLGVVLFEKLGYPVLQRTRKTRSYSTGAETLEELAARGYPLPEKLLRYREVQKLKSTYVDALPALVAADGRVHTRYLQAVAATGRLSSVNPNLQNIPVRGGLGQQIRRAFVAPPGAVLLVADYSQIELRVLAHIAGEPALAEAFQAGEDIHRATAARVFGVAPELVTPDQRRAAKVINFGILYGMSAFGLGRNLGIPSGEADRFIKAYLERYPKIRQYMDETLKSAQRDGRVETLFGRVRYLPDIKSKNFALRENARRMAINARVQGTAADLQKKAMIAVDRALRSVHPQARLLLTVHDELVLEAPESEAAAVAELVRREMEGVAELAVPLEAETGWGRTWYDAKAT
jgi:DNA polymerase-1